MEGTSALMMQWVGAGTSPVDWCEANYTVTPHIAEFVNTFSNILFLIVPAACSTLWSSYARQVSRGIHVVWIFFTVIGLSSAYFHATLSLLGQLLDELSILWVLMVSYTLFTPIQYRPSFLRDNPREYSAIITVLAVLITASAFVQPAINAYALFLVGGPAITMLVPDNIKYNSHNYAHLSKGTVIFLDSQALGWTGTGFSCPWGTGKPFPDVLGVWDYGIMTPTSWYYDHDVLFCYFHAIQDVPESKPSLRYWPYEKWGLPYVYCKSDKQNKTP
ncbi:unnamed protein product, partial [Meganyctiphanes norvegica]